MGNKVLTRWSEVARAGRLLSSGLLVCVAALLSSQVAEAAGAQAVPASVYRDAERFLPSSRDRMVLNGDIRPYWIEGRDEFWYKEAQDPERWQFVRVNAATGKRGPAFDHAAIADQLARSQDEKVSPDRLPFSYFQYGEGESSIRFTWRDSDWSCTKGAPRCVESARIPLAANEALSPLGNWVLASRDHNLWIRPSDSTSARQLTRDGERWNEYGYDDFGVVSIERANPNGRPPGVIWSPDEKWVLTYRYDTRLVKDFYLVETVPADGSARPVLHQYRYALPGDEHVPMLQFVAIDLETGTVHPVDDASPKGQPANGVIAARSAWWSADGKTAYFLRHNRYANEVTLGAFDRNAGTSRVIWTEKAPGPGPIRLNDSTAGYDRPAVATLSNGDVIWFSERTGRAHLYYVDASRGEIRNAITAGDWAVSDLLHVDEARRVVYFRARGREPGTDPYYRYVYRANFDGSGIQRLTEEEGEHLVADWEAQPSWRGPGPRETSPFSPSGRYFVENYSTVATPPTWVVRRSDTGRARAIVTADISRLAAGGLPRVERFSALAADGRTMLYGNIYRPTNLDPAASYPIVDANYGGPSSIIAATNYTSMFNFYGTQALAELGFVVIVMDGRGTPGRSREFLAHALGHMERASDVNDHVAVIQELARRYPYIDQGRVGIYGASGGGYGAARAMLMRPDFFKVAVASVGNHDQSSYIFSWGEIYNGEYDKAKFDPSSNVTLAANLRGKLLLMHGELDDNVHPANTMKLVDALIKNNKDFDLLLVPGGGHGSFATPYFTRRTWDYFVTNLQGRSPPPDYRIGEH